MDERRLFDEIAADMDELKYLLESVYDVWNSDAQQIHLENCAEISEHYRQVKEQCLQHLPAAAEEWEEVIF